MSSVSSGLDLPAKYQRLTAEFVKVRNQVSVLKTAVLDKQVELEDLRQEVAGRDMKLRKLESERDSLQFRNDQLVKRVQTLQDSLEAQQAAFGAPGKGGKKRHKEANLRLVAETSQQALSGVHHHAGTANNNGTGRMTSESNRSLVLEEELERKIVENGELHSKIFDLERRYEEAISEWQPRVEALERENNNLKKYSNSCDPVPLSAGYNNSIEKNDDEKDKMDKKREADRNRFNLERIERLSSELQTMTARATYYKQECEELVRKSLSDQSRIEELELLVNGLEVKCASLTDDLERTRQNYEQQMRQLYEHMTSAGQNANSKTSAKENGCQSRN